MVIVYTASFYSDLHQRCLVTDMVSAPPSVCAICVCHPIKENGGCNEKCTMLCNSLKDRSDERAGKDESSPGCSGDQATNGYNTENNSLRHNEYKCVCLSDARIESLHFPKRGDPDSLCRVMAHVIFFLSDFPSLLLIPDKGKPVQITSTYTSNCIKWSRNHTQNELSAA